MAKRPDEEIPDTKITDKDGEEYGPSGPDGHDFHQVLTNSEFRAAQKEALKNLETARRKDAMASVIKAEEGRLAREAGMVVGGDKQKLMTDVINLVDPEINSCLMVNGTPYWHGQQYTLPAHVWESLREQMWRLERYTAREIRGEKLGEFYMRQRATALSGVNGVRNAPQPVGGRRAA